MSQNENSLMNRIGTRSKARGVKSSSQLLCTLRNGRTKSVRKHMKIRGEVFQKKREFLLN